MAVCDLENAFIFPSLCSHAHQNVQTSQQKKPPLSASKCDSFVSQNAFFSFLLWSIKEIYYSYD